MRVPNILQNRFFQNKKIRVSLIAILILVVGLGGYYAWRYSVISAEPVEETVVITPTVVTQQVEEQLRARFTPEDFYFIEKKEAPYWAIGESPLYVNYSDADAASFDAVFDDKETAAYTADDITKLRTDIIFTIQDALESIGMAEADGTAYTGSTSAYIGYGIVCTFDALASASMTTTSPVSLHCGTIAHYTPELSTFKAITPFLDSYVAAGNGIEDGDTFTLQPSGEGQFSYDKATVTHGNVSQVDGTNLLFYKESSSKDWQYFTSTQDVLACSDYNTSALRAAFRGDACYNTGTNTESKVK